MNMLRSVSAATPSRDEVAPCTHPVPLAELERGLGGAPVEGWELHLAKQGVPIVPDKLHSEGASQSIFNLETHECDRGHLGLTDVVRSRSARVITIPWASGELPASHGANSLAAQVCFGGVASAPWSTWPRN